MYTFSILSSGWKRAKRQNRNASTYYDARKRTIKREAGQVEYITYGGYPVKKKKKEKSIRNLNGHKINNPTRVYQRSMEIAIDLGEIANI